MNCHFAFERQLIFEIDFRNTPILFRLEVIRSTSHEFRIHMRILLRTLEKVRPKSKDETCVDGKANQYHMPPAARLIGSHHKQQVEKKVKNIFSRHFL